MECTYVCSTPISLDGGFNDWQAYLIFRLGELSVRYSHKSIE